MKFRKMMGVTAAFLCAALALSGCGSTAADNTANTEVTAEAVAKVKEILESQIS